MSDACVAQSSRPAIERPGLESQRSRKRHFFHRKIFKFFKYYLNYYIGNFTLHSRAIDLGRVTVCSRVEENESPLSYHHPRIECKTQVHVDILSF